MTGVVCALAHTAWGHQALTPPGCTEFRSYKSLTRLLTLAFTKTPHLTSTLAALSHPSSLSLPRLRFPGVHLGSFPQ